jgi:hypothetical protein
MLMLKMQQVQIVYDASGRLDRVRQYTAQRIQSGDWLLPSPESTLYADWFWRNHILFHVKRMAQSSDPIYLTAVDMMLVSGLSTITRIYFRTHNLPWQGEKAAVRYLQTHDAAYLALFRAWLAATDSKRKITLYEQLVAETLAPIGPLWTPGITAIFLRDSAGHPAQVAEALSLWETLLGD